MEPLISSFIHRPVNSPILRSVFPQAPCYQTPSICVTAFSLCHTISVVHIASQSTSISLKIEQDWVELQFSK
jgi:hypothetical protein